MKYKKQIFIASIILAWIGFKISTRTNTIWGINYNQGIDVPNSTSDIKFDSYLWLINFRMDGNGSVVKCEMNKNDFENFLRTQKWCNKCHGIGEFKNFPDSLIGKYPMESIELKSKIADVLKVHAKQLNGENKVEVWFFTDNN